MQREEIKFPENSELSQDIKDLVKIMLTYDHQLRPNFQQLKEMPYIKSLYARHESQKIEVETYIEDSKLQEDKIDAEYEFLSEISLDEIEAVDIDTEDKKCDDKPEVRVESNY